MIQNHNIEHRLSWQASLYGRSGQTLTDGTAHNAFDLFADLVANRDTNDYYSGLAALVILERAVASETRRADRRDE